MIKNIFTDCEYIRLGCKFYLDRNLETIAPAGKYSDGTNCFSVDSLGLVTSVNACSEFTTTTSTSTTSTSTTSTSTTTSTTTTTTAVPDYRKGNYNSGFQARGNGSIIRLTAGPGGNGCLEANWNYGPGAQSIDGSGITAYTVYTASLQLTSGSSYTPDVIINGVSVPGLVWWPLDDNYECGQSPLFVTKIEGGVSSSIAIIPGTSIPVSNGGIVEYWQYLGGGAYNQRPPYSAVTGSDFVEIPVTPAQYSMYKIIQTFTSSGNFYYNKFTY